MNSTVETILLYTIAAGFLSIVYGYFTGKNIHNSSDYDNAVAFHQNVAYVTLFSMSLSALLTFLPY